MKWALLVSSLSTTSSSYNTIVICVGRSSLEQAARGKVKASSLSFILKNTQAKEEHILG